MTTDDDVPQQRPKNMFESLGEPQKSNNNDDDDHAYYELLVGNYGHEDIEEAQQQQNSPFKSSLIYASKW